MASTYLALQAGLPEGNYLPSLLLDNGGEASMYLFKATTSLLVMVAVIRLSPRYRRVWYSIHAANVILVVTVLLNLAQVIAA